MLNSVASSSRADPGLGRDGDIDTDGGGLSVRRRRSLEWQACELEQTLEDFAFIADVTILAPDCRSVGDAEVLVARYDGLLFTALTLHSEHAAGNRDTIYRRMVTLTGRLIPPDETFYCLVDEGHSSLVPPGSEEKFWS